MMRRFGFMLAAIAVLGFTAWQAQARFGAHQDDENKAEQPRNPKLSEKDTYMDLNTGKAFQFIYDDLNGIYNRSDLLQPDLYVNTRTKDTFWLYDAILVNHALIRDDNGIYRVNPMKVKRDGDSYRVVGASR
ncbi:MAG: hypothetical protein JST06_07985 [Bacteroidetes bacterium]|nr:hypothetical protein [Bacteroidota bacterium]MBS1630712.1 hypothetical protein [Bacteroidota bacterium]